MESEKILELKAPTQIQLISGKKYEECEWCFQFDNDEPHVFAWTNEDMENEEPQIQFTISNNEHSNITFTHPTGKVFKIFAREMTEKGRELQQKQKLFENGTES